MKDFDNMTQKDLDAAGRLSPADPAHNFSCQNCMSDTDSYVFGFGKTGTCPSCHIKTIVYPVVPRFN